MCRLKEIAHTKNVMLKASCTEQHLPSNYKDCTFQSNELPSLEDDHTNREI